MNKELISLTGILPGYQIELLPEAEKLKSAALAAGKAIIQVQSDDDQRVAAEAMVTIKGLIDGMEKTRKAVKDPVYQAGKTIDAVAKKYAEELERELDRVKRLMGAYVQEQQRKAAQAERERLAAIQKQREEEERVAALKMEEERLAELARNAKGKEAERLARETEEARTQRIDAELAAMDAEDTAMLQPVAPVKAAGTSAVKRYKITVTDIHALYAHNRRLVRLEPNLADLQDLAMCTNGAPIPGVIFEEEVQIRVSGSVPRLAIG